MLQHVSLHHYYCKPAERREQSTGGCTGGPNNETHLLHRCEKVMMIQPRKPQMLFWPPPKCLSSDIIQHQGAACSQRGDLPLGYGVL